MATIQFTLQDLMVFFAYLIGIAAGALLIIILWKIRKVLCNVQSLIDSNKEAVIKTVNAIPAVMDDVKHISSNIVDVSDNFKDSVPGLLKDTESIAGSAKASLETASIIIENVGSGINDTVDEYKKNESGIITYIHIAEEIFKIIYKAFTSKK